MPSPTWRSGLKKKIRNAAMSTVPQGLGHPGWLIRSTRLLWRQLPLCRWGGHGATHSSLCLGPQQPCSEINSVWMDVAMQKLILKLQGFTLLTILWTRNSRGAVDGRAYMLALLHGGLRVAGLLAHLASPRVSVLRAT